MPANSLGAEVPRQGWGFICPLLLANAIYADIPEPIRVTDEADIFKYKDKITKEEFAALLILRRQFLAEEIWLLPIPTLMKMQNR